MLVVLQMVTTRIASLVQELAMILMLLEHLLLRSLAASKVPAARQIELRVVTNIHASMPSALLA